MKTQILEQTMPDHSKRKISIRLLEDGTDRACIHWLREHPDGLIIIQGTGIRNIRDITSKDATPLPLNARGSIACNPKQTSVQPREVNGVHLMCLFSNDVRAATCPDCLATVNAVELLEADRTREQTASGVPQTSVDSIKVAAGAA